MFPFKAMTFLIYSLPLLDLSMWENIAKPICLFLPASLRCDIMALCTAEVFLKGDKPVSVEHLNNKKQF